MTVCQLAARTMDGGRIGEGRVGEKKRGGKHGAQHHGRPIARFGEGPRMGLLLAEFALSDRVQAFLTSRSADRECACGRLPGDPTPPCGCWGDESTD